MGFLETGCSKKIRSVQDQKKHHPYVQKLPHPDRRRRQGQHGSFNDHTGQVGIPDMPPVYDICSEYGADGGDPVRCISGLRHLSVGQRQEIVFLLPGARQGQHGSFNDHTG